MTRIYSPDRVHFSDLKWIDESPAIFQKMRGWHGEESDDLLIGNALHALTLRGIQPTKPWEGRRAGNGYKAAVAENGGHDLLTEKQHASVLAMHESLMASEKVRELLARCTSFETHREWDRVLPNGAVIKCAGTSDGEGPDIVLDLKSAKSAKPRLFQSDARRRRYPEQLTWYDAGGGTNPLDEFPEHRDCYLIAVGKTWPYPVSIHQVTPLKWIKANENVTKWLTMYHECVTSGHWPGWDAEISEFDITEYELSKENEEE